jgi:ribosome-binding factor A
VPFEIESEEAAFAAALEARGEHKVRQLCREVERTLSSVLSGDLGDDRLGTLALVSVEPAPDASRLMVTLAAPADLGDPGPLVERLRGLSGYLRADVAAAIQRKRTPELCFCVIGGGPFQ